MKKLFLLIALFSTLSIGCTTNMIDNLKGLISKPNKEQPNMIDTHIPHIQIWYTTSDGYSIEPYIDEEYDQNNITVFGANIISNEYDAEKECWVIMFDDNVTSIGDGAFTWCDSLTSIIIPNSVTSIGDQAFYHCDSLTSIIIPSSVTSIGEGAFFGCTDLIEFKGKYASKDGRCLIIDGTLNSFAPAELTEYTIPNSVTSIGNFAFSLAYYLTSVTIPDSVTTIGMGAFYACDSLTSITIPDSVTTIGEGAFYYCSSLTSITIPDSVTTIEGYAFCECSSLIEFKGKYASEDGRCLIVDGTLNSFAPAGLTEYTIPDGATTIGDYVFYYCDSLTSIAIPDSVTTIRDWAFYNCSSLTSVYCKATTPPAGGYGVFYENADDRKIYVPMESVDAYKSAEGWSEYADDIVGYNFE